MHSPEKTSHITVDTFQGLEAHEEGYRLVTLVPDAVHDRKGSYPVVQRIVGNRYDGTVSGIIKLRQVEEPFEQVFIHPVRVDIAQHDEQTGEFRRNGTSGEPVIKLMVRQAVEIRQTQAA